MTNGIHHITAISSDAQKTYDFYTKILGLRLVKKTVNFDSPDTYHLYFADNVGTPGTNLTFFPFPNAGTGMRGIGQVTTIAFAVNTKSLEYWLGRFIDFKIKHELIKKRFKQSVLTFYDYDGLQLELVGTDENLEVELWKDSSVPAQHQIKGFYSATLSVDQKEKTENVLRLLGYQKEIEEGNITRYKNKTAKLAIYIDIFEMTGWPAGKQSAGTVHHIAFSVKNDKEELKLREKIIDLDLKPTEVVNRDYFKSVYFREPGGILFEIATDGPGFDIDESVENLGTKLQLPERYENLRSEIEAILPALNTFEDETSFYVHKYLEGQGTGDKGQEVLVLFHGTGGNENDLLKIAKELNPDASILALRGDVLENGMNRFFERIEEGVFDEEDIKIRVSNFKEFILAAAKKYKFNLKNMTYLGYSNGANFIASIMFLGPELIHKAALLRASMPLSSVNKVDLKGKEIFVSSGEKDKFAPREKVDALVKALKVNNATVENIQLNAGHELIKNDIVMLEKWFTSLK